MGAALARSARLERVEDGAIVGALGDRARTITGLVHGALLVSLPIDDGSVRPLHLLQPGSWLASRALVRGAPRRVALSACGRTELVRLDEDAVDRLVASHPAIWRWLTELAARHLDAALDACAGLLADRPLSRIASRLLALSEAAPTGAGAIELKQNDLAQLSGVSRNTLSRTLGQLEAMALIARGYRRLRVLDRAGLARVAAGRAPDGPQP